MPMKAWVFKFSALRKTVLETVSLWMITYTAWNFRQQQADACEGEKVFSAYYIRRNDDWKYHLYVQSVQKTYFLLDEVIDKKRDRSFLLLVTLVYQKQ